MTPASECAALDPDLGDPPRDRSGRGQPPGRFVVRADRNRVLTKWIRGRIRIERIAQSNDFALSLDFDQVFDPSAGRELESKDPRQPAVVRDEPKPLGKPRHEGRQADRVCPSHISKDGGSIDVLGVLLVRDDTRIDRHCDGHPGMLSAASARRHVQEGGPVD